MHSPAVSGNFSQPGGDLAEILAGRSIFIFATGQLGVGISEAKRLFADGLSARRSTKGDILLAFGTSDPVGRFDPRTTGLLQTY
jgi:hypothetical protein